MTPEQKRNYISLFALDIPMEEIMGQVGVSATGVLTARIDDPEFDRQCDVALRQQRSVLLSRMAKIEGEMLAGKYFANRGQANSVIKSLQWRIGYLDEYDTLTRPAAGGDGAAFTVELIEQVDAV